MKRLIAVLIILLAGFNTVEAQWQQLNEPEGGHILDLAAQDGSIFISVANTIYKSDDFGQNWVNSRGNLPEMSDINSIGATSGALYAGVNDSGTGQKLFVSYDKGATWTETGGKGPTILGVDWETIGDTAFVITNFGGVMRTTDNGATFEDLPKASIGNTLDVWGDELFYLGQGLVRMSTNRGDSVSARIGTSNIIGFNYGTMRSAIRLDTVLLVGAQGVFKLDANSVWQYASDGMPKSNGVPQPLISKLAYAGERLWAFSGEGIYSSADTARTWTLLENSPSTGYIQRVELVGNTFHLATQNGYFISNGAMDSTITFEQRIEGLNHVTIGGLSSIGDKLFAYSLSTGLLTSDDNGSGFTQFGGNLSAEVFSQLTKSGGTYYAIINSTLHSSIDGSDWTVVENAPRMFAVEALHDTLYASAGSQIYKSRDMGENWEVVAPSFKLGSIAPTSYAFHDSVIFGGFRSLNVFGSIARSLDGGNTWEITDGPKSLSVSSEVVFIGNTAFAPVNTTFKGGGVARSTDFGETWEIVANSLNDENGGAYEIEVLGNVLYTITLNGIWKSDDEAQTWEKLNLDGLPTTTFYSGLPIKVHNGFIYHAPYNNGIYRMEIESNSTTVEQRSEIVHEFELEQNYPNPFNPNTNINFSLPEAGLVSLNVYNVLGQQVATIVNQKMTSGSHSVSFNASRLSSGIYIYRLQAGNNVQTKKMLLVK